MKEEIDLSDVDQHLHQVRSPFINTTRLYLFLGITKGYKKCIYINTYIQYVHINITVHVLNWIILSADDDKDGY